MGIGVYMSRISPEQKMLKYFTIYEHMYEDPFISAYALSEKTGISRKTVSAYLKEMYAKKIISGPFLSMKLVQNYTEYLYFMNFSDPMKIFEGLKEFPHIVYHALTFGSWNTCIISERPLDFSRQVGFFPEGKENYSVCTFLLSSNYKKEVKSLFSHFPTSSLYMDMGEKMMIRVYVKDPDCMRKLF